MQIQNEPSRKKSDPRAQGVPGSRDKAGGAGQSGAASGFHQIMSANAKDIQDSFDQLLNSVDQMAEQLLKEPDERRLTAYTDAVRKLIRKAQGQAFSVDKTYDRHNRLYTVVREVDSQLAELTDQVISGQWKALEMAARIQEIRGILLDMYI